MKRISVFTIILLLLVSSVSYAHYYGISARFRTRYSPYAFSHKYPVGLISGELHYSPYAVGYYPAGLIPYWFRYSPYAFSHEHPSGLISDYGSYFYFPYSCRYFGLVRNSDCPTESKDNYEKRLKAQADRTRRLIDYQNRINIVRETDGKEIISNYLKSKNINDFEMDRIFSVNNKTVSVNFVLRDKNLIIKYWNPEEIQALLQQPGYKKNFYEKYEQSWKDLYEKYKQAGKKVYHIESASKEEILNKLSLCHELNEG